MAWRRRASVGDSRTTAHLPYKKRNSLEIRQHEAVNMKNKFPNKVPIIIERYERERTLPPLDKTKFLVPTNINVSQLVTVIRNRMELRGSDALYLLVDGRALGAMSATLHELHARYADADGFLYVAYASQESFG